MLERLMMLIAVIAIAFLSFGPEKTPELARSIGLARREFNNASALVSRPSVGWFQFCDIGHRVCAPSELRLHSLGREPRAYRAVPGETHRVEDVGRGRSHITRRSLDGRRADVIGNKI